MTETPKVVSLNKVRKDRDRAADKAQADANAVKHGRTKVQRLAEAMQTDMIRKRLDQLKFDDE